MNIEVFATTQYEMLNEEEFHRLKIHKENIAAYMKKKSRNVKLENLIYPLKELEYLPIFNVSPHTHMIITIITCSLLILIIVSRLICCCLKKRCRQQPRPQMQLPEIAENLMYENGDELVPLRQIRPRIRERHGTVA